MINKAKLWLAAFFTRVIPHTRNVHFVNEDGIVSSMLWVNHNKVFFCWLKKPELKEDALKKYPTVGELWGNSHKSLVCLNFYDTESIDRFIEQLKKVKLNIQLDEAGKILNEGGTMEWKWDGGHIPESFDGKEYTVHTATIEFKMPEIKPLTNDTE